MFVITAILTVLLAVAYAAAGAAKVTEAPAMRQAASRVNYSMQSFRLIGGLEIGGALGLLVGLWVEWLGILSAACLLVLMVLAVGVHLQHDDKPKDYTPPAVLASLTLLALIFRSVTA